MHSANAPVDSQLPHEDGSGANEGGFPEEEEWDSSADEGDDLFEGTFLEVST